ncbi:hypothetical protein TGAMA5MH_09874 [Trichoderma gamsii]|uniref:F-box domain-containing protein n=1 Tax=Trichoderma gamsii TaxID=398673 RepID=A0A2K0SYF8_9HYPO|nr:hypothetical protein TGAMA5MH_09874 [Trichoderma gamsii]
MSLLQSLYALYRWFFPDPTPAAPNCPILGLPDELVLCITGHLAAHDQFLLSQTCRTMRRLVSRDWNEYLRSRSLSERNNFLIAVAYGSPYHWACETCGRLHTIDPDDLPSVSRSPTCVQPIEYGARIWARYYLEHHHIQLALKLYGRGVNTNYLEGLLTTHHYTTISSDLTISYTARPRIAEGHFLLRERIIVGNGNNRATYSNMQHSWMTICPHMAMVDSPLDYRGMVAWLHQTAELYQAVTQAILHPGQEIHRHCRWCPTDYSAFYHQRHGQLVFSAWHDFGAYGSVSNPYWSSQARRQTGRGHQLPPRFSRMPGASRAAYTNRRLWRL